MAFSSALALFAHPDDAEFMFGGTVARWAREGTEVHYVCVTDGSAGSNEPGMTRERLRPIREREQRAAAEVLGVASVTFLGYPDGGLEVTREARRDVAREVRRLRPEVILAPDPSRLWYGSTYINHRDHRIVGELALCAVMPDAPTRPQFPELLEEGFEPYEVPRLWLSTEEPDTFVDIEETLDLKLRALACHASQWHEGDDVEGWVRKRAAELGAKAGMAYAEGFRAFTLTDGDET
ncbi:MAG TPA: PIG-L deacetylase family protein [Actinomycetota bacterium]|nr:PIG-L deacetylase family protein [Actinomycetota bacterium]